MKKLNVAIIGQGRSGKNIHGKFLLSELNERFNVKFVVEKDAKCRELASARYEGVTVFSDYTELFAHRDEIDMVVNASYSYMHFPVTRDLLEHKFNVLVEKPFAKTRYECDVLIKTAKDNGVVLGVFQNTFKAPFYEAALKVAKSGKLGKIEQVSVRYNNFARRWDWQTLQKTVGGNAYNTGPHPIGIALGFLDFHPETKLVFSKLDNTCMFSGDADNYAKLILTAPDHPVVDVEISSTDAFGDYNIKLQGEKGTYKAGNYDYKIKYVVDGENPERPLIEQSLHGDDYEPVYCGEKLVAHEEEGKYVGDAFDVGAKAVYEGMYDAIVFGKPLEVSPEKAAMIVSVIEEAHAANPLKVRFL